MTADEQAPAVSGAGGGETPGKPFPIVGIGASAGGVYALQELFERLPHDLNAAFVVVMHLDPEHESELASILAVRTRMPVVQVTERTRLEAGRVYIIPPNRQLIVTDQHLAVAEFEEPRFQRAPIDLFFRSLAAQRDDDFAIVLSGAGSDGAIGIKAVKEAGGIILVQDPDEAEYGSMPRAAISTGFADFVLPLREIATKLPDLLRYRGRLPQEDATRSDYDAMQRILSHLRVRTGHDFSAYKKSTVRRRIARRMQVQRAASMPGYLTILRENAAESQALFADLLISVTTFFRDPAAFDKLARLVIPSLFEDKWAGDAVRVWVPGCATGEEAYSIGMLLLEESAKREIRCEIHVFATDLDEAALAAAREGRYPAAIEADMTEERLRRFFIRENDEYRVTPELRDIVLVARHSLLKDPPFSRTDLISCRNVLIYLDRELQQQVAATFHFALRSNGYLFLGSAESADTPAGLFRALDRESRIYQRLPASADLRMTARIGPPSFGVEPLPARTPQPHRPRNEPAVHREALERFAPPSAIVDESYRVLHLSETAGRYLQPSRGTLVNEITELAREELRFDLRTALHTAFSRNEASLSGPIAVRFNGSARRVYLHARPFAGDGGPARAAIVFFFEGEALGELGPVVEERSQTEQVQQLQQELQFIQSQLRTSREEYEGANEELRAANEELQSMNEEYRSTAEELETSKEELQSVNEELQTLNSELKVKFESESRAHSDIQNLMVATDVGILFLDTQLRIKRFTPRISELFNIAVGDVGRSITDFTHELEYDGLADEARRVLRDLTTSERETRTRAGAWYLMRLRPYRTAENKIDGVVVTFVDIGERRRVEQAMRESEARMRAVIDGVADAIITADGRGLVQSVNVATTRMFGYSADELVGRDVNVLAADPREPHSDGPLRRFFENGGGRIDGSNREVEARRKDGSLFPTELSVTEIRHDGEPLFIGFVRDLSERRRFEARLSKLHANRLDSMADMATALAHELNQPLAAGTNYISLARQLAGDPAQAQKPALREAIDKAASQLMRAGHIIAHLREFMARGEPNRVEQSLHALIRRACDLAAPSARERDVEIVLALDAVEDAVLADSVHVEQALLNLIRNAMEAMEQTTERTLTISTATQDGMIRTEVADTGHGLSEQANTELFTPFTSTKATGLGVGLSISRSIIESHYGTIWAEANAGGGAKFCFSLPLARTERDEFGP